MILVTGADGFLGNALIMRLRILGLNVMPLIYGKKVVLTDNCWQADLTCMEHINELKKKDVNPSVLIHLAGYIEIALCPNPINNFMAPIPGIENISRLYESNVGITANLVEYCLAKGVRSFIFASSQAVYGFSSNEILTEDSECNPLEHYAASKLCAENLLEVASKQGLDVTIFRFPGLYSNKRSSGVVHNFCKLALYKKHIKVDVNYPLPFDVIHVDDVVDAYLAALNLNKNNFLKLNISTGQPCSLDLLATSISNLVRDCHVEHASVVQPIIIMDSSKAQKLLNWKPMDREQRLEQLLIGLKNDKSISASC